MYGRQSRGGASSKRKGDGGDGTGRAAEETDGGNGLVNTENDMEICDYRQRGSGAGISGETLA